MTIFAILSGLLLVAFAIANGLSIRQATQLTHVEGAAHSYAMSAVGALHIIVVATGSMVLPLPYDYSFVLLTYSFIWLGLWALVAHGWVNTFSLAHLSRSSSMWHRNLLLRRKAYRKWWKVAGGGYRLVVVLSLYYNMQYMATAIVLACPVYSAIASLLSRQNSLTDESPARINPIINYAFNAMVVIFAVCFWLMPPVSLWQWLVECWECLIGYSCQIF